MSLKKPFLFKFILIGLLFINIISYSQNSSENDFSQRVKIVLREIGNQLLLENNDSTSLILPVREVSENKFEITFEKDLSFEPTQLVAILKSNLTNHQISKNYRVEVLQCLDYEVAYSFEINKKNEKTIIPCSGRILPKECYTIQVLFLDNTYSQNFSFLWYLIIPIVIGIAYIIYKDKKEKVLKIDELNTTLGSFVFYPHQNKLVKKAKEISLSKKEVELLNIFIKNKNKVVKREELTKKVWEDNGVFVGRSLDTYVSKLRKKLQEDSSIKLVNIHGVGYKLEVN